MLRSFLLGLVMLAYLGSTAGASGRPMGCPARAWCGCFLSHDLGIHRRDLWVARNWAKIGVPAGGPVAGAIVVWRHHVGVIKRVTSKGKAIVRSGNDGGRVRERERSISGAIAFRVLHGSYMSMWASRKGPRPKIASWQQSRDQVVFGQGP